MHSLIYGMLLNFGAHFICGLMEYLSMKRSCIKLAKTLTYGVRREVRIAKAGVILNCS